MQWDFTYAVGPNTWTHTCCVTMNIRNKAMHSMTIHLQRNITHVTQHDLMHTT